MARKKATKVKRRTSRVKKVKSKRKKATKIIKKSKKENVSANHIKRFLRGLILILLIPIAIIMLGVLIPESPIDSDLMFLAIVLIYFTIGAYVMGWLADKLTNEWIK